jgi:hypothetical protein
MSREPTLDTSSTPPPTTPSTSLEDTRRPLHTALAGIDIDYSAELVEAEQFLTYLLYILHVHIFTFIYFQRRIIE